MNVLITGAAGFIGSQLAYRLKKENNNLILIDNFSYGKLDNLVFDDYDFTKEVRKIDIRDKDKIEKIFKEENIDYVYNLAGIAPLPDCQIDPIEAIDVNVSGFANILENARKYGVLKVIQASTNALYENVDSFPTVEDDFVLPTLIYPNTKYMAECLAKSFSDTYNMSVTCLRFANVYGPHIDCLRKQPPFVGYMIRELFYDNIPVFHSDGEQKRDYIYVDDLIDLAIAVQKFQGFDAVNCSSNTSYSVNEMYNIASKIMCKDIRPKYASDLNYWVKYPEIFTGKYKMSEEILAHEIKKYTKCDNSYAKNKYNWEPHINMQQGLENVIKYQSELLNKIKESK